MVALGPQKYKEKYFVLGTIVIWRGSKCLERHMNVSHEIFSNNKLPTIGTRAGNSFKFVHTMVGFFYPNIYYYCIKQRINKHKYIIIINYYLKRTLKKSLQNFVINTIFKHKIFIKFQKLKCRQNKQNSEQLMLELVSRCKNTFRFIFE